MSTLPTANTVLANLTKYKFQVALFLFALLTTGVQMANAQVPTLAVDPDALQTGLFTGANIILIALGGIVFLLIGFSFGGKILRAISDFIQRFSF